VTTGIAFLEKGESMNTRVIGAVIDNIVLRPPKRRDGADLHDLIARCPPLDLNSRYAYLLLCEHHGATCIVAEAGGELVGAVTAYIRPAIEPEEVSTLFIWQVAVAPHAQGQRLASRMLDQLTARCAVTHRFHKIETTISPSNIGSQKLFDSYAKRFNIGITAQPYFAASDFGDGKHEEEWLYQLG
jgi:L-2,4-diaminobutyric acid acetyltransferase